LDTREEKTCHPLREAIQLNAVALLYRKKRREGKKREKRKDVIHQGKQ